MPQPPTPAPCLGKSHWSCPNPVFTCHFRPQGPEGRVGRLGVLGGPSLRLGRDTYKPTDLPSFLSSCLGALRALLGAAAASAAPSGGRDERRRGLRAGMGTWAGVGGCLGTSRPGPLVVAGVQTPPAPFQAVSAPPVLSPTQSPVGTHPHALESRQCPQGTQSPECPQGFDGSQLRVAQPVGHQADDGDL